MSLWRPLTVEHNAQRRGLGEIQWDQFVITSIYPTITAFSNLLKNTG